MFAAYIVGAVLVSISLVLILATQRDSAARVIGSLVGLFYLFLVIYGAMHS